MKRRPHEIHFVHRTGRDEVAVVLDQWLEGQLNAGQVATSFRKIYTKITMIPKGLRVRRFSDRTFMDLLNTLVEVFEAMQHDSSYEPNRHTWNYLQRVKLLLASNACLIQRTQYRLHGSHLLAAAGLVGYIALSIWLWDIKYIWLLYTAPFGLIAGLVWWWRTKEENRWSSESGEDRRVPFGSYAQIMQVRRSVLKFHKQPFVEKDEAASHVETAGKFGLGHKCFIYMKSLIGLALDCFNLYALFMFFTIFSPVMLLLGLQPLTKDTTELKWGNHGCDLEATSSP